MKRRIAVTGIGLICGVASSADKLAEALKEGKNGFTELTDPRLAHLKADHAALVKEICLSAKDEALTRDMDRVVRLSVFALRQALTHAGLTAPLGPRAATVLGTCSGGMLSTEKQFENKQNGSFALTEPDYFSARYYSAAKTAALAAGASGPTAAVVTACAAGTGAISYGADLIRAGLCDVSLAGGADTFAVSTLIGFDALKAVCKGVCTPFSENIGLNLGEGAGFLVLESMEHARRRGATVLGEILGSGLSNDAYHATSPDPSGKGQTAAVERALLDAGVEYHQIDYISAHGTGTRANDAVESRAIARLLKEKSDKTPISSTKSMIGHCLGAAGALEAAAVLVAAREKVLPPTAGFTVPREGCSLDYVPELGRPMGDSIVLSNSFGFGGNNACLVLSTGSNPEAPVEKKETPAMRPVITGTGTVHALGLGRETLDDDSRTGITRVTRFQTTDERADAGFVPNIDFREVDRRLDLRHMDLCSKYLTVASRLALKNADIPIKPSATANIGMVSGLSFGPSVAEAAHVQSVIENNWKLGRVDSFPYVVQNGTAGHAARALLLKGHNTVLSTGRGAGLAALVSAASAVELGHAQTLAAAASDELSERSFGDARAAGIYGDRTVPGEGAAAFVVESKEAASVRGANVCAEIIGYGAATDVENRVCITKDSALSALTSAVERAGIHGSDIRRIAVLGTDCVVGALEEEAAKETCPRAERISAARQIGVPEASLCLINLDRALYLSSPGDAVAGLSLSREGLAHAVILRRV